MRARQTGADADHSFNRRRCAARLAENPSGVRHLPAGLEIEGRLRQRDESASAAGQRVDQRPLLVEQADDRYAADPRRRVPLETVAVVLQPDGRLDVELLSLPASELALHARLDR